MKNVIPFTRFHLPDGRQSPTNIEVDDETFAAYEKVRDAGLRMTVELLSTGAVSQCIEDPNWGDFDCVISRNDPDVLVQLKKMLLRFNVADLEKWRHSIEND